MSDYSFQFTLKLQPRAYLLARCYAVTQQLQKIEISYDVTLRWPSKVYWRLGGQCYLSLEGAAVQEDLDSWTLKKEVKSPSYTPVPVGVMSQNTSGLHAYSELFIEECRRENKWLCVCWLLGTATKDCVIGGRRHLKTSVIQLCAIFILVMNMAMFRLQQPLLASFTSLHPSVCGLTSFMVTFELLTLPI